MAQTSFLARGLFADRPSHLTIPPDTIGLYWSTDLDELSIWTSEINTWTENVLTSAATTWGLIIGDIEDQTDLWTIIEELRAGIDAINPEDNGLVSGGIVTWESAYNFRVSAATYFINGVLYSSLEQTITLDASDPALDRIDVIALDTTETVVKITGTAASEPNKPDSDPFTQLELTFVIVPAASTEPDGIVVENIYLENTEWTTSTSGAGWDANSTNFPYAGTKDVEGSAIASNSYIEFERGSTIVLDDYDLFQLFIRSKATWPGTRGLRFQFYLSGVAKGSSRVLRHGQYGFDSSVTGQYQFVALPMTEFNLPAGTSINQLRVTDVGGAIGFYIDNITLQDNALNNGDDQFLTIVQGDARYLQRALNLSDLTNAATARTNLGVPYATSGEINTGTEAAKVVSPDAFAGSNFGKETITIAVSDPNGAAITTGDGKFYYRVPATMNGMNLVSVAAALTTASSSGIPTVQVANVTQAVDMLSTKLTIDANETDSSTAATAAVIDAANDDVATADILRIDIDVAGTGAKGLIVELGFQLP